jgi:energy-converting hydrogenase Eha subunit C
MVVKVLARATHILPDIFSNETAPIVVGCVAESRPIDNMFVVRETGLPTALIAIENVEIAHVAVLLPPIITSPELELIVVFNVVPVSVTDVAPAPKFAQDAVNVALVDTNVPPTEMSIEENVAVLELQKFSVVEALACVNEYWTFAVLAPGLLNVTVYVPAAAGVCVIFGE